MESKANIFKKCIANMKAHTYMDVIKQLIDAKKSICQKAREDVTGENVAQLQAVCDNFDNLVRLKNDSEDVKRLEMVISAFRYYSKSFVR